MKIYHIYLLLMLVISITSVGTSAVKSCWNLVKIFSPQITYKATSFITYKDRWIKSKITQKAKAEDIKALLYPEDLKQEWQEQEDWKIQRERKNGIKDLLYSLLSLFVWGIVLITHLVLFKKERKEEKKA